jgi:hypothetical protein
MGCSPHDRLLQVFPHIPKKNGQQLDKSHCPFRGGMNETYKGIDPVRVVMFKPERLQLGNPQHYDRSEPWIEEFGEKTGRWWDIFALCKFYLVLKTPLGKAKK